MESCNKKTRRCQSKKRICIWNHNTEGGNGIIWVKFLKHEIPSFLIKSITRFIANHAPTRNVDCESGIMVAAGMWVDTTSSAKLLYMPSRNNNNQTAGRSTVFLHDASFDFNAIWCLKRAVMMFYKRIYNFWRTIVTYWFFHPLIILQMFLFIPATQSHTIWRTLLMTILSHSLFSTYQ